LTGPGNDDEFQQAGEFYGIAPFRKERDVIRAEGDEVLHTKDEVERIRQEAQKTKN